MAKVHIYISKSAHRKIMLEKKRLMKIKKKSRRLANKRIDSALALDILLKNG